MSKLFVALLVFVATQAQASVLPQNVRALMLEKIAAQCKVLDVREVETQVTTKEYDQGKFDVTYVTKFSATYLLGGELPVEAIMYVTAVTDEVAYRVFEVSDVRPRTPGACGYGY